MMKLPTNEPTSANKRAAANRRARFAKRFQLDASTIPFSHLPFGRLWYGEPNAISNAIGYAEFYSRSHDAVIRVYNESGNVIQTHEHAGDFKEW